MPGRSDRGIERFRVAGGVVVTPRIRLGEEVADALAEARPVVGLETSVIGQGLPHPRNVEGIDRMAGAIRGTGAVPAWIGVVAGQVVVGLPEAELSAFTEPGRVDKVARRDLPAACALGGFGATTVSATIWAAARAGIAVSATGGIGGVHPGEHPDVSPDLVQLSRTPGLLVCAGPKSIVDPVATMERLEELGVTVLGYGVSRLPFFLAREAPVELAGWVDDADQAAATLRAAVELDSGSTILLCNPIPSAVAMDAVAVAVAVEEAEARVARTGVRGRDRTPAVLAALADVTGGRSIEVNLELLAGNAALAGEVASSFAAEDRER